MSVSARIGIFVAGLLVVFAAAVGIGSLTDPAETEDQAGLGGEEPAGLDAAEGGYSLHLDSTTFERGEERQLRFRIEDADGAAVGDFDELHERRMHLIDADLFVSGGDFEARPFPPPAAVDSTGGYEVRLRAQDAEAGGSSQLSFTVSRGGAAVDDLAPHLGAKGHLVALREGDLAFLHVHPEEAGEGHGHGGHSAAAAAADEIAFAASFPTAGRYRLYLQFKHDGAVRTAQFTISVPR